MSQQIKNNGGKDKENINKPTFQNEEAAKHKEGSGNNKKEIAPKEEGSEYHFRTNISNISNLANIVIAICAVTGIILGYCNSSEQNKITRESLEHFKNNSIIENRPYISVENFIVREYAINKQFNATVRLKNYGKTPAFNFRSAQYVFTEAKDSLYDFTNTLIKDDGNTIVLAPDNSVGLPINSTRIVTGGMIDSISNRKLFLFVFGKALYSDSFENEYLTTFCYIYDNRFGFRFYEKYNKDKMFLRNQN